MTTFSFSYFAKSTRKAENCIFSTVLFSKYTFFSLWIALLKHETRYAGGVWQQWVLERLYLVVLSQHNSSRANPTCRQCICWWDGLTDSGSMARPNPWAPEKQKARGNCGAFPFSKTQGEQPCGSLVQAGSEDPEQTLSPAAASSCAPHANWWLYSPTRWPSSSWAAGQLARGWHRRRHLPRVSLVLGQGQWLLEGSSHHCCFQNG